MGRICFISAGLNGGGMERSLTSLANYCAESGHEVSIVNLFRTGVFFELNKNIKVIWPSIERSNYNRMLYTLMSIPYLRKSIRILNPEVILSFGEWFNSFVIISTRFLNIPVYVSDRMGPNINLGLLLETARRYSYKYAKGIIAQTNIAAITIKTKTNAKNIKVIPNAVSFINVNQLKKKKQIVTVGRLTKEKGHIFLIQAFARLEHSEWSLHIVGDGDQRNQLEEESEKLGINDRVSFYGHLKEFNEILGESEIFVLPSLYEGFPNALVEAMSVPLACVSSDCIAGPAEIIDDGINGLLVESGNVNLLVSKLDFLIKNDTIRNQMAEQAYKIRIKYKFDFLADQYIGFILG